MNKLINFIASKRRYYEVTEHIMLEDGTIMTEITYPNIKS